MEMARLAGATLRQHALRVILTCMCCADPSGPPRPEQNEVHYAHHHAESGEAIKTLTLFSLAHPW